MTDLTSVEDRIRKEFSTAQKEYAAFDRTLDALSALNLVLRGVKEIAHETEVVDFRAKIQPVEPDTDPYTPDGVILGRPCDFVLELKTSWNDRDIRQIIKYGKSPALILGDGKTRSFQDRRCQLLGYQNTPGEAHLNSLFEGWKSSGISFPLVLFRYSLEQAPDGDRMYFARVAYSQNGQCPPSSFGQALNSPRGISVSTDRYKVYRPRFHRANDQVIASYAAVLWWTKYVMHYLSADQRSEMAENGRLSAPLVLRTEQIAEIPKLPEVDVPLGPNDVRHALEFLAQAKLVNLKKRSGAFEVELKEDRYIRIPHGGPVSGSGSHLDISTKILARWATHRVRKPIKPPAKRGGARRTRRGAAVDSRQSKLDF
jgi:hypothetical protein